MSWDPLQRGILEALGHVLYAFEGAEASGQAAAMAVSNDGDEATLRALLRAAGRRHDDEAARARCLEWLRAGGVRDAAARRALWPRLRALRRAAGA